MSYVRSLVLAAFFAVIVSDIVAAERAELKKVTWKVGDTEREAMVYAPDGEKRPLIFAWHGHGGSANYAVRKFNLHELWPEAVVVYPQGLPTPAPLVDPEGKRSGWQKYIGDQGNRDLDFFDAMLKRMIADHHIDEGNIFSMGHSNGGYFTYVLLAARGDKLKAIAPVAATANLRDIKELKPKPVLHVAGEKDPLVKYALQEKTIDYMKKLNSCEGEGKPWGEHCTEFASTTGNPVVAFLHSGAHEVPDSAPEKIIQFFKQQARK